MLRRDFGKAALGVIASTALRNPAEASARLAPGSDFPKTTGLTEYVSKFVATTTYSDIPGDVIELGKKSILDGLGLALAGSKTQTGSISRRYVASLGICDGETTLIGSSQRTSPRFAAFVNGVSIHADDFDDTQLSAAKDRVYGLLVHPNGAGAARHAGDRRTWRRLRQGIDAGLSRGCRSGMQDCRSHFAPPLSGRISFDGDVRTIRFGFGLGKATWIRPFENSQRFWSGGKPVGRPARKLRHHDQAFPGWTCRGERARICRSGRARLGSRRTDSGSGPGLLPRLRWIFEESATKFKGCAAYIDWPKAKTEKIIALVKSLDTVPDVRVLFPLLSSEKG